jgi:hypothetical protein
MLLNILKCISMFIPSGAYMSIQPHLKFNTFELKYTSVYHFKMFLIDSNFRNSNIRIFCVSAMFHYVWQVKIETSCPGRVKSNYFTTAKCHNLIVNVDYIMKAITNSVASSKKLEPENLDAITCSYKIVLCQACKFYHSWRQLWSHDTVVLLLVHF